VEEQEDFGENPARAAPTKEIEQEQTERTEKEERKPLRIAVCPSHSVLLVFRKMHPLFDKASGLTETIIAAAIEVHRVTKAPDSSNPFMSGVW
jgi:hypothetical protein